MTAETQNVGQTYSTPFLRVRPSKRTRALELLLVHGHMLIVARLERLALGHPLRQRLFLVHDGGPDERIFVSTLRMEHVLTLNQRG